MYDAMGEDEEKFFLKSLNKENIKSNQVEQNCHEVRNFVRVIK